MGDDARIKGERIKISYNDTKDFFERRAEKINLPNLYNHTMYQDNNPKLVEERDKYEKNKICKILNFNKDDIVLDLGCGVARWGEVVLKSNAMYVGIDFSKGLIKLAEENLRKYGDSFKLINSSFDEFRLALKASNCDFKFTKVLITAVMIYINDDEIDKALSDVTNIVDSDCMIYIKESISKNERLTLNKYHSEDLNDSYSAIYRTKQEYIDFINHHFPKNKNFNIKYQGPLFEDSMLNNRSDTEQYFYIIEKED